MVVRKGIQEPEHWTLILALPHPLPAAIPQAFELSSVQWDNDMYVIQLL